ncbi:methionine synthase [Methanobacterium paludis]|uniref:Methionine synthase vitamin-B12 independent n=1 Tax=Methanobacterium paludis (strain DSM 25820 / JCM 18151 / SWAN1) TaxID=868131 RepID=F6D467_METPW|nr:methionine synthase [Methanobacterium paludis]AEG17489.1 Methionine synthase vitamin-B12 independent [Methanobacterium paludis]
MLKTVVGSYPAFPQEPSSVSSKIADLFGSYDRYKPALELAVHDQIKAGIDLISDGQVRGDMIEAFAGKIPGMTVEGNISKIVGKIKPLPHSLGASDLKLTINTAKKISNEFDKSELLIKGKFNENFKGVKGIVTGPTTLVLSCRIEGFYDKDKKDDAIIDLAWALKKEVEYLEEAGAAVIQIDEPFLSTGVADINTAKKAVEIVTKDINVPVSMHVCGGIGSVFNDLLGFKVDIVDCEFAGLPENIHALESSNLRGKKIGFGCIDTKKEEVETTEDVSDLIKMGIDLIGEENMIIDPDCGMRMLSRETAFAKLKTMTEAVEWLS